MGSEGLVAGEEGVGNLERAIGAVLRRAFLGLGEALL
jgi:hypothetical protein